MDRTRMTGKAPAAVLIVAITATAACGGGSSNVRPFAPEVVAVPVTEWIDNRTAEDLRDHYWYPPEVIRQLLGLTPVADADLADRRSTLAQVLEEAQSDAATSRTRLRNVVADDVTILGERDGITYGRWTDGPAGTLSIEFDWRFVQGLDAATRARMERVGKAWSRRLLDRKEVVGPTELDFAYLADIGYDVLDARTAGEPEVYGYGAWARYSAWGAGVERVLDAPGGSRDTLRAGADAFGVAPDATLASAHGVTGTVRWEGALLGVDLGQPMLPPVTGNAALDVYLETLEGAASFDNLAVHVEGVTRAFRNPALEYVITVSGNGFSDDASRVSGHLFGPHHEEMAGVLFDRSEAVNLLAVFGGTRD